MIISWALGRSSGALRRIPGFCGTALRMSVSGNEKRCRQAPPAVAVIEVQRRDRSDFLKPLKKRISVYEEEVCGHGDVPVILQERLERFVQLGPLFRIVVSQDSQ